MTKRDRLMLTAVVVIALLGGFWMLILGPQRKAAAEVAEQVTVAQTALDDARGRVTSGRKAQESFRSDRTTIVKLGRVVPETDDLPTLLTQLEALAKREKVKFLALSVDSAGTSSSAGGSASTDKSSSSAGKQAGSSWTSAVAPLYPPGTVEIAGGLGRTPLTLEFEGTYFQLERYLRAVQRFAVLSQKQSRTKGRLMIVDGFSYEYADADSGSSNAEKSKVLQAWDKTPNLKAKLSASVYFAPPLTAPSASAAAGSSAAPAGTAPATSGSSTGTAAIGGLK